MILHLELDDGVVVRARTSAIDLRLRTAAEVAEALTAADPPDAPPADGEAR